MPDGSPYGPHRYTEIVEERYLITKFTHTSYGDTGEITPSERQLLLKFIKRDLEREVELKKKSEALV